MMETIDLKAQRFTRDREGHFIMLKGLIHQEAVTVLNAYTYNKFSN